MSSAAQGPVPDNIFLVGMMGAGKTSVGKMLARNLGKDFYDSDQVIEARTGVKIPVIFELEGEAGFRAREAAVIEELTALHGVVLATGGGAVLDEANRRLLHARGTVVYLRAAVNDLWNRTRHDRNRPLLQTPDPLGRLRELYTERDPLYRGVAHIVVETGSQSLKALVMKLQQKLGQDAVSRPTAGADRQNGP
jgi:shikimate kinase